MAPDDTQTLDLSNNVDLVEFDRQCAETVSECPQSYGDTFIDPTEPSRNNTNPTEVFMWWKSHPTLWEQGWSVNLSDEVKFTFDRYQLRLSVDVGIEDPRPGVVDSLTGRELSKKNRQIWIINRDET